MPKGTGHEQHGTDYGVTVQGNEFLPPPPPEELWGIDDALLTVLGLD